MKFANEKIIEKELKDISGWNEILLPSDIVSNYLKVTLKSAFEGNYFSLMPEIQIIGCESGNHYDFVKYCMLSKKMIALMNQFLFNGTHLFNVY